MGCAYSSPAATQPAAVGVRAEEVQVVVGGEQDAAATAQPSAAGARAAVDTEQDALAAAADALPEERKRMRREAGLSEPLETSMGDLAWKAAGGLVLEEMIRDMDLIDLRYAVRLIEAGGAMPRWQDVPPSAKITSRSLWRLNTIIDWGSAHLAVIVLSYPWLDREHPDRLGEQLRAMLPLFKLALAEIEEQHHTFGLMMDYPCLPQKPFASEDERAIQKRGLASINRWYTHPFMMTLCLTGQLPNGAAYTNTRLHRERGWCRFEIAAASLIKTEKALLDFPSLDHGATDLLHAVMSMKKGRAPPLAPPEFAEQMRTDVAAEKVKFTAGADMEFVIEQYRIGFLEAFTTYKEKFGGLVWWRSLGWGEAEAPQLLTALEYLRDHWPEDGAKITIDLRHNNFSEQTKDSIRTVCAPFVRTLHLP